MKQPGDLPRSGHAFHTHILFFGSAVALLVMLLLAWAYRYEQVDVSKSWSLAEMKPIAGDMDQTQWNLSGHRVTLDTQAGKDRPMRTLVLELPGSGKVDALHLNYRIACDNLVAGETTWNKGRLSIHWLAEQAKDGGENDPVHDFAGDGIIHIRSRVVAPTQAPAIPRIMILHMGRSGGFTVEDLRICAVQERALWKWARVALGLAATAWFFFLFRACSPRGGWASATFLSLLCMGMIIAVILPKEANVKPQLWGMTYQLGSKPSLVLLPPRPEIATTTVTAGQEATAEAQPPSVDTPKQKVQAPESQATEPSSVVISPTPYPHGKIKAKRSIIVWIKMRLSRFSPLLHVLAFVLPTLAIARLAGIRPAAIIGSSFALASEASQLLFGDVWDVRDQMDLLLNLTGVALALAIARIARWSGALQAP